MEIQIQVNWADLDLYGHANNVAYFRFIQTSRIALMENLGIDVLNQNQEMGFIVASTKCDFLIPLTLNEKVYITPKIKSIFNSSFEVAYSMENQKKEIVALGQDVLVLFNYHLNKKILLSESLKQDMAKHL